MTKKNFQNFMGAFALLFLSGVLSAQTVTLSFTGQDANNQYVQLDRVVITNQTKGWQEIIYWPDTTLTMQNGTGVENYANNGGFSLSQNNPNPFNGSTDVSLMVAEEGMVKLQIADVNGRAIVATEYFSTLQPGNHLFRISLSAVGTYVMTAYQNGKISSVKMICNEGRGTNGIDYIDTMQHITYVLKSTTNNPFDFGDQMGYVGYATINGGEVESQHLNQIQESSQTFVLPFDVVQYSLPMVTTYTPSSVFMTYANCGGNVTSDGGTTVTARGLCWSTDQNPTISDSHMSYGNGTGMFSGTITELTPSTTYFVRAYATNCAGTAYGSTVSFTTTNPQDGQPCTGMSILTDVDGNVYNTVQIGVQCWMKENLRTTHFADSVEIPMGSNMSLSEPYRYLPDNNENIVSEYGYLYNWFAVMHGEATSSANPSRVQGICPTGWHVPSSAEWSELTQYVSGQIDYRCNSSSSYIAKALADSTGWDNSTNTCAVGNMPSQNNATGFSARPAGMSTGSSFNYLGNSAFFWSATEASSNNDAFHIRMGANNNFLQLTNLGKYEGVSVRCVRN